MRLYRTFEGIFVDYHDETFWLPETDWDELVNQKGLTGYVAAALEPALDFAERRELPADKLLPPVLSQEVWAAGVTYYRSREARKEESAEAGGGDFYQRVYAAERPELFFKSTPSRVVGHGQQVRIRKDSKWSVPEPELTLLLNSEGSIVGYTIGNDMSSRDIEGENPLYLPQAKVYDRSCALGPCLWVAEEGLSNNTEIALQIERRGESVFHGSTSLTQLKRSFEELGSFLFRECSFPSGCYLMTGTGIIPPADFSLVSGDQISITIEPIGTLRNTVA